MLKQHFFEAPRHNGRKHQPKRVKYSVPEYKEEEKENRPPVFTNSKIKLRPDVPVFKPREEKEESDEDDFMVSEIKMNPKSKAFEPSSKLAKDRFADLGPSENDMNVENILPVKVEGKKQ